MKSRAFLIVAALLAAAAVLGGIALSGPIGASVESPMEEEGVPVVADPAMLDLGNADAGAMMAMINRAIGLHD